MNLSPSKLKVLVGIIGHKDSGKTTYMGRALSAYRFRQVHPAEPIRAMLLPFLRAWGFNDSTIQRMLEGDLKRTQIPGFPEGITPTSLQQSLGTEWGRECVSPTLWLDMWGKRAAESERVYNDSIRFPNEAQLILGRGGYLIRVSRSAVDFAEDMHPSEQHVPHLPYHFRIANEGDMEDFLAQANPIIKTILASPDARQSGIPLKNAAKITS